MQSAIVHEGRTIAEETNIAKITQDHRRLIQGYKAEGCFHP